MDETSLSEKKAVQQNGIEASQSENQILLSNSQKMSTIGSYTGIEQSANISTINQPLLLRLFNRSPIIVQFLLGQVLSLMLCGTAVTSGLLQEEDVHIPTAQTFLNYFLLASTYTSMLFWRRPEVSWKQFFRTRGWKYVFLALADVEGNFLIVTAYQYTSITSVQFLNCFTVPCVMLLSFFILRVRYKLMHLSGAAIALLGMACIVVADVTMQQDQREDYASNAPIGDILCIAGVVLYAISNVMQEFTVKNFDRVEFLGMIGIYGSFISGIQLIILERDAISRIDFNAKIVLSFLGYVACMYAFYSTMSIFIKWTSAAVISISLLSSNFYTLLFGLFLFKYDFHILYFVAIVMVYVGIILYSSRPTAVKPDRIPSIEGQINIPEHTTLQSSCHLVSK